MTTPTIRAALDAFQQAANRGTAVHLSLKLVNELRDALEAGPDAEALAARPLLEQVARLGDVIGAQTVGQITAISARAAAWLRENPPGQPVAIEPRACPTPGACSCVEPAPPATEPGEELSDQALEALEAKFEAWHQREYGRAPGGIVMAVSVEWGSHLLSHPSAATLPALEPGEVAALMAALRDPCISPLLTERTRAATLLQQHAAELAALQGVAVAVSDRLPGEGDLHPEGKWCWGWKYGRYWAMMQVDCFGGEPDPDKGTHWRPYNAIPLPAPQAGEVQPPHPTFLHAIRLAQGCHDYSGGHSGNLGEAFQDGVGTVVAVLKKAAVGPWDSQTMAVFGVGSAPQTGEGEA